MEATSDAKLAVEIALRELVRSTPFQLIRDLFVKEFGLAADLYFWRTMEKIAQFRKPYNLFCYLMRTTELGQRRCVACDERHFKRVAEQRKSIEFYTCHAGMIDILAPVRAGSEIIGLLTLGQILDHSPTEKDFKKVWLRFHDIGIPKKTLQKAYFATPVLTRKQARLMMLIMQLVAQLVVDSATRMMRFKQDPSKAVVEEVRKFCEKEYASPLRLSDLGHVAHLHPTHLCRVFKQKTGTRLFDFIRQVRLSEAKKLLLATDEKITDIALACGFQDLSHFFHTFRSKTGMTPAAYRRTFERTRRS